MRSARRSKATTLAAILIAVTGGGHPGGHHFVGFITWPALTTLPSFITAAVDITSAVG